MSKIDPRFLPIPTGAADPELAQQQDRFDALVREVAQWRGARSEWMERMARCRSLVGPVWRDYRAAWRQWVLALDHAGLQPGLSRAERAQLAQLLSDAVAPLLDEDDPEMAAVASRHAEPAARAPSTPVGAEPAASSPSPPAGPGDGAGEPDESGNGTGDWEQQAAQAAARRAQRAAQRRAASRLKQRGEEEEAGRESLRDVYRRLASALHPDREPDARQRARKTLLMQHANQAYAEDDLQSLLELRLRTEPLDAGPRAGTALRRLQGCVAMLQRQLEELQSQTRRLEDEFRAATGLAPGAGLPSRRADRLITAQAQRLREEARSLRRHALAMRDAEDLKAWLRAQRKAPPRG